MSDSILNPTIFIGAFEWREPVTTFTDFLVSVVAFYAFYRLHTYTGKKVKHFAYYKYYFLCFAIGMCSAAWFGHALQAYVGPRMKIIGWCMSATGFVFLAWASLKEITPLLPTWVTKSLQTWILLQYLIMLPLTIHPATSNFILPQINSTIMLMVLILPMHLFNYWQTKNQGSFLIILAIAYGVVPGFVYNLQFSFGRWFNYHDISHVLMAIFMLLMYQGIRQITGMNAKVAPIARNHPTPI